MATQLQIRRGTAAQVAAFTGAEGEIVYNSTNDSLHTNDGATAGGFELARADLNNVLDADLNAALTGNTLSALTITTLTATGGTINGTTIGATTPASVAATTLSTTGAATFSGNVSASGVFVGGTPFTNSVVSGVSSLGPTIGAQQTSATQYAGGFWNTAVGDVNLLAFFAGAGGTGIGGIAGNSTSISLVGSGGSGLAIASTGAATFSGNVGIGDTTFAAGKLQVYDSAGNHVWLKGRASDGTSSVSFRNNADNAYNGRIQVADTGGMLFQVAGSTRATIDASGNVIFAASGGAIKSIGGDVSLVQGAVGLRINDSGLAISPTTSSANSDAAVDLGVSNIRFKDLYLSSNANVAGVVASGSVIASLFRTGSFSYSSGTTTIVTIPANSTYLFMARPNNYGGGDSRHGAVYIIRRWGSHTSNAVQLAQSASNYGVFTVSAAGTVSYSGTGGGIPSTAIYWMRIG